MKLASLYLEWDLEKYSIGQTQIDDQHRMLFIQYNNIVSHIEQEVAKALISDALGSFCQQAEIHFRTEEEMMKLIHYPYLKEHAEVHNQLLQALKVIRKDFEHAEDTAILELVESLQIWLHNHLLNMDMPLKKLLK